METELIMKVVFYSGLLVGCGYYLGKDKGVKVGAGKVVDHLCDLSLIHI